MSRFIEILMATARIFLRRLKVHVTDVANFARDFLHLAQKHDYKLRVRQ